MKRYASMIFLILCFLTPSIAYCQPENSKSLKAHWSFDTIYSESKILEKVNGGLEEIEGYTKLTKGVKGRCLKLDGYTTRVAGKLNESSELFDGLTIESWIALQALPWNWSAIVSQGSKDIQQEQSKTAIVNLNNLSKGLTGAQFGSSDLTRPIGKHQLFFGVDALGHLGLKLNINGKLYKCVTEEKLPLLMWNHVVATFDSNEGMKIFINGELAAELNVQGTIKQEEDSDFLLGMNIQRLSPAGSERQASADIKSKMVLDGLLDEIKIYNQPLTGNDIKKRYKENKPSVLQALKWKKMPSGPESLSSRFDGFYTRLKYTDEWEAPRRESDHPDILIHFDKLPVRFIFWRGTNYGGSWITENGLWMGDQSVERAGRGKSPMGCSEHMSDKQARYGNVRIVEKNDARIVVQWRYAIADIIYDIFGTNTGTVNNTGDGWGEWADEYYYIYPDGVSTRHQTLWTEFLSHEFQETIVLNHPGTRPEDNIMTDALTLVNMEGDSRTYSWKDDIDLMREARSKGAFPGPEKPNIQMVNLKSQFKPFIIFEPHPEIVPFNPNTIRPEYSLFPWWNHWPAGQLPNDGRRAFGHGRPSHSSLSQSVEDSEVIHNMGDGSYEVVTLVGMTDKPAASLAMLARSWNNAPEISLKSKGFSVQGYSKKERAFIISNNEASPFDLKFTLHANENSPLVNPSFVIKDWGNTDVELKVNGDKIPRGESFRYGFRKNLKGTDLVCWIELKTNINADFTLNPVKNSK